MKGQDGTFPNYGTEYERAGFLDYAKIKPGRPGTICIKIGLPGKLINSKRKGLQEVLFS